MKSFSFFLTSCDCFGTFMQLIMYICLRFPTLSVANVMLLKMYYIVLWNSSKVHLINLQLESIYRQRTTQELQILTMDFLFLFSPLCTYFFFFSFHNDVVMCLFYFFQTTSKSVTVNHIQSFSINIPHTVMCTFVLLKWIYGIHKKYSLLHFSTVTVIQTVAIVYIR